MSVQEIMMEVWAIGGVITRRGDKLRVETKGKGVPPLLREAIRANKAALLGVVTERQDAELGQRNFTSSQQLGRKSSQSD